MRIIYFGDDFFIECFHILKQYGHIISHIVVANEDDYTSQLTALGEKENIPVLTGAFSGRFVDDLISKNNTDMIFSAGYSRKIKFDYSSIYSINIHPSILPNGRGPDAAAWISLKHRNFAGFTFHKISAEFDEGDIISQFHISLAVNDGWEMYMAKLKIEIIRAFPDLLENFKESYGAAKPQSSGSSWPSITAKERLIHWDMPHEQIHSIIRSFGRWGAIVQVGSQYLLVNNLELSVYQHRLPIGNILSSDTYSITVSTSEGLAIIPKKCVVREIPLDEACSLGLPIS